MTRKLAWTPPSSWPKPGPGWRPPPGWEPDPAWPPAPEGWEWWQPAPRTPGVPWLLASGATFPLALLSLFAGLEVPSLALVYVSIFASLAWIPLLAIGLVKLLRERNTA